MAGRAVDVRVSTIPAGHGERVVLRLLDKQAGRLTLSSLGMSEGDQNAITIAGIDKLSNQDLELRRDRLLPASSLSTDEAVEAVAALGRGVREK